MSSILDVLLAVLYPPACPACGRDLHSPGPPRLCGACARSLRGPNRPCDRCAEPEGAPRCARCRRLPPPFGRVLCCCAYRPDGPVAELLGRWKYGGDAHVGVALSQLFAARTAEDGTCYDLVVPVPLHPAKLWRRGFNQAGVLARALVRRRSQAGRLRARVLSRRRAAGVQAALGRGARAANVSEAFAATARIDDCRVLLVDDVLTSGATASACARALIGAGAIEVDVAVLARTAKRSGD